MLLHGCLNGVGMADIVDNMVICYLHIYSRISALLISECHLLLVTLEFQYWLCMSITLVGDYQGGNPKKGITVIVAGQESQ